MFHFRSWVRRVSGRIFRNRFRWGRTWQPKSLQPRFEVLEDRTVPSTITVLNTNDSGTDSLRQAILDAHSGDTIDFASNVTGTINLTTGELAITKNLTISGPGAGTLAVSGEHGSRVFDIGSVTVSISGLTIEDGSAGIFSGGAILNAGTLTLSGMTIENSAAYYGAGIFSSGTLTLTDSTVSANTATVQGGGIFNSGTATVSSSTVSGNLATHQYGGGIFNSSTLTLADSTLYGNMAYSGGGGIASGNAATVTDSTIAATAPPATATAHPTCSPRPAAAWMSGPARSRWKTPLSPATPRPARVPTSAGLSPTTATT